MDDKRLDSYLSAAVQNLKNSGYKEREMRDSFEKIIRKPFQNLFFLILVYIACLLTGIIILSLSNLSSLLLAGSFIFYVLIAILSLLLGFAGYFGFGYFRISKITKFILIFSLSLLISGTIFLINNYFLSLMSDLQQRIISNYSNLSGFVDIFDLSKMSNIWVVIGIIVVFYNLLSIINIFRKD